MVIGSNRGTDMEGVYRLIRLQTRRPSNQRPPRWSSHHQRLIDRIDNAMKDGPYIAGSDYSLADIAATPYMWRLTKLRLAGNSVWHFRLII